MADRGRPRLIESPEDMQSMFEEYKQWVFDNPIKIEDYVGKDALRVMREKPRPLTIEGFENHCFRNYGITALQQYLENRDEKYTDFLSIVRTIKHEIRQNQIEGGMAGIFNQSLTARLNNLKEATDVTTNGKDVNAGIIVQSKEDKDNIEKIG